MGLVSVRVRVRVSVRVRVMVMVRVKDKIRHSVEGMVTVRVPIKV